MEDKEVCRWDRCMFTEKKENMKDKMWENREEKGSPLLGEEWRGKAGEVDDGQNLNGL